MCESATRTQRMTCSTPHKDHWAKPQSKQSQIKWGPQGKEATEAQEPTSQRQWPTGLGLVRSTQWFDRTAPSSVGAKSFPCDGKDSGGGVGAKEPLEPPLHPYIRRPPPPSHNTHHKSLSLSHLYSIVLGSSGA